MDTVKSIEKDGLTVEIWNDTDPLNPRDDYDHFGKIEAFNHRNFWRHETKGQNFRTPEEFVSWFKGQGGVCLNLYAYIHSGITIRVGQGNPFTCPWDSGQVGFVYATKEDILKEYGGKRLSKGKIEKTVKLLTAEIETFDSYLTGEVYGYTVKDETTGEDLDSCGGFIGDMKFCEQEGLSMLDYHIKQRKEQATKQAEDFKNIMACK